MDPNALKPGDKGHSPVQRRMDWEKDMANDLPLGAEGVIPSRQIEGFLRDFKQYTHNIPKGQIVGFFNILKTNSQFGSISAQTLNKLIEYMVEQIVIKL